MKCFAGTKCYVWSHGLDKSRKRQFFVVLHQGYVDSPAKAVKTAIVKEFRRWAKIKSQDNGLNIDPLV